MKEALRTTHTDSVEASEVKQTKRNFVGPQAFNALIKGFVDSEGPDQSRRWMGVLALVLLDSPQTTALVLSDSVKMQASQDLVTLGKTSIAYTTSSGELLATSSNMGGVKSSNLLLARSYVSCLKKGSRLKICGLRRLIAKSTRDFRGLQVVIRSGSPRSKVSLMISKKGNILHKSK